LAPRSAVQITSGFHSLVDRLAGGEFNRLQIVADARSHGSKHDIVGQGVDGVGESSLLDLAVSDVAEKAGEPLQLRVQVPLSVV
jgi:hypothetical protein